MVQTMEAKMKYKEMTKCIIRYTMRAHFILGNGIQEVIYKRALE